jgi:hypothetical protein
MLTYGAKESGMPKSNMDRRQFMGSGVPAVVLGMTQSGRPVEAAAAHHEAQTPVVDFRFAPLSGQAAFCFPDDPHKSLVGGCGELRCGHPGPGKPIEYFPLIVEFSLRGMEPDRVAGQSLEAPGVPIVHTRIDRPEVFLELITFATNDPAEGRVDNVILEVRPRRDRAVHAVPLITLRTRSEVSVEKQSVRVGGRLLLAADTPLRATDDENRYVLAAAEGVATDDRPLRRLFRFPQQAQDLERLQAGLAQPDRLLAEARAYWRVWRPFSGSLAWKMTGRQQEFLVACARNILQAREERNGKLTFQVGPTVYRGLWVVDGHFLLESARYLGYDAEAQQGLEATWARQQADGGIFAGGGREHWKDTGIALFTLVRQAELAQDWTYFRRLQPEVLRAIGFLRGLRDQARGQNNGNGRYGLLAPGFGDGGLGGIRPEFTNTLWSLAGLRATTEAAGRLGLPGFEEARRFYRELRSALYAAARQEMRRHAGGFSYLPMLMKEDPQWSAPDQWNRPRPQTAQWALSHAIYPGLVFDKQDPVVRGHIALMQACTQEDVPIETGWLPHEGLWNYNAPFVSHVYLWAGLADWARLTFTGFLNHATRLYCWREEQPLRGSAVAGYVGDMPHNWASAECVLYLRHMLALEDGDSLRLLAGIGAPELAAGDPYLLSGSPTRFGRISLTLENGDTDCALRYQREPGPQPAKVELPARLGALPFRDSGTATFRREGGTILVDPSANSWVARWRT